MKTTSRSLETLVDRELDRQGDQDPVVLGVDGVDLHTRVTGTSRDIFGIALSGGGIRSATFNLGVLQGLHQFRLLERLDYLSTVSGGGYIGSFWTAWRERMALRLVTVRDEKQLPVAGERLVVVATTEAGRLHIRIFGADGQRLADVGEAELTHPAEALAELKGRLDAVREPTRPTREERRGVLAAVATLVGEPELFPQGTGSDGRPEPNPVRHLREFSNFLAPRLGFLNWDTGRIVVTLVSSVVPSLLTALAVIALAVLAWALLAYGFFALEPVLSTATFVGATALLLLAMEAVWRRRKEEADRLEYAKAWLIGLLWTGFLWWLMHLLLWPEGQGWYGAGQRLPVIDDPRAPAEWFFLLAPVVPWLVASLMLSLWRWGTSRGVAGHRDRVRRNSFDRVHARFLFAAAMWTVVAALWWVGALLWGFAERGYGPEVTTGLGGATAAVVLLFSRVQKRLGAEFKNRVGAGVMATLRPMLPRVLAYAAIGLMVVGTIAAIVGFDRSDVTFNPPLAVALLSGLVLASTALLFNPNEIGLHTFYRARISRAYLGASNPDGQLEGKTEERQDDDLPLDEIRARRPCHLICCAANDLSSGELGNLQRGAVSAVLSPVGLAVGGEGRAWRRGDPETPTLSAAVTASAAAFNPLMGGKSKELGPAVTFLMAAFNLRLGLWLRRGDARRSGLERHLVGLPFLREMFGLASAAGRHVHLSDGGHFENMAVYELIRRHCRFIIAADCGMDPTVSFDDFGNLVRRVRADFGVDIRIDLSPLRPDANRVSRQPMVAGDIHYPEGDTGILLLIKPTITGSEPADVAQYRTRNTVFPHESTVDQFYDEAQWEAYRRLGEHVAHAAFRRVGADLDTASPAYVNQVFVRARREWQAVPDGFGERLAHFADRVERLDSLLREPDCTTLLREVYKEIDDLDRDRVPALGLFDETGVFPHAGPTAKPERSRLPDPKDLAPSLHLIRRVLLLMQEAYTRENLEENHHHPLYLGLMNYFARWTSAPLFRLWWPLLKTMYPQPFTRFVEHHYGVSMGERRGDPVAGEVGAPGGEVQGFAMSCWQQQRPEPLKPEQAVVPFLIKLRYREHGYTVQAAQVVVVEAGRDLVWDAADFFVPPGLWGIGIGEQFLRGLRTRSDNARLQAGLEAEEGLERFDRLFVRIRLDPNAGAAGKKRAANEMQLYRSAGFQEVAGDRVPEEVEQALARRDGSGEVGGTAAGHRVSAKWMRSARAPAGVVSQAAASSREDAVA